MANRNDDTWYFGNPHAEHPIRAQNEIISALQVKHSDYAFVSNMSFIGPSVCVYGCGIYGSQLVFTDESWKELEKGIVVHDWFDSFSVFGHTIIIAGETVLEETFNWGDIEPKDENAPEGEGFTRFEGRTPEERAYFKAFWAAFPNRTGKQVIIDALKEMKLRKQFMDRRGVQI